MSAPFHVSPSQIKTYTLCPSKWHFQSVQKIPSPTSDKAQRGTDAHAELELYYNTGVLPNTPKVLASLSDPRMPKFQPEPAAKSKILIEKELPVTLPGGALVKQKADLIDLNDPFCPLIIDHKTSGSCDFFLNEYQLRDDPQVISYARAVLELHAPGARMIRLAQNQISWGALDLPRWVECTVSSDFVHAQWNKIETEIIANMEKDRAKPVSEVARNLNACTAFGGCPFAERCQSNMFANLEEIIEMPRARNPFLESLTEDLPLEVATSKPKTLPEVIAQVKKNEGDYKAKIACLYVDCLPSSETVTYLSDLLHEPLRELAVKTGVPDWRLHDYGKGKGYVASALKTLASQGRLPANLYINTREDISSVALEVLSPLAAFCVFGTR